MNEFSIGKIKINKTAGLAPMASVGDSAFRTICKSFGASYLVSEMASSKALCYSDKKTNQLLHLSAYEYPIAIQLFGDEPDFMAKACKIVEKYQPQIIDINMGCPVPKVAGNGAGSALLKNPNLAFDIVKSMVNTTSIPITVKIRKGWDDDNVNAVEFSKMMEQAGASAITVHGRTRMQMYKPPIDLEIIKKVKDNISIPVIGNGGIENALDAQNMYQKTGCDLVVIGQGSYGNPWIFKEISHFIETGELLSRPSLEEKMEVLHKHINLIVKLKGEKIGMLESRKHIAWYLKGIHSAAKLKNEANRLESVNQLEDFIDDVLTLNKNCEFR